MRPVYRPTPVLPVQAMQTYGILRPAQTHTRRATCHEVECSARANGWVTRIDVSTDLGGRQANYIRLMSGRFFVTEQVGDIVSFTFAPGQSCFADHRITLERDPFFLKVGGDWRGRTSEPTLMRATDWVDDFGEHQQDIADRRKKG